MANNGRHPIMDIQAFLIASDDQQSFLFGSTGYGAALAWIMLALIAFITWILFATKKLWVYDGGL